MLRSELAKNSMVSSSSLQVSSTSIHRIPGWQWVFMKVIVPLPLRSDQRRSLSCGTLQGCLKNGGSDLNQAASLFSLQIPNLDCIPLSEIMKSNMSSVAV